jgi:hypothetical protein
MVSLLWQSKQARWASTRVCGLSQAGSPVTGGLVSINKAITVSSSAPTASIMSHLTGEDIFAIFNPLFNEIICRIV